MSPIRQTARGCTKREFSVEGEGGAHEVCNALAIGCGRGVLALTRGEGASINKEEWGASVNKGRVC